jgi:hypothetical protein
MKKIDINQIIKASVSYDRVLDELTEKQGMAFLKQLNKYINLKEDVNDRDAAFESMKADLYWGAKIEVPVDNDKFNWYGEELCLI